MKICMVSDEHYPHTGADTIVVISTASALGKAGAEVELVVPRLWWKNKSAKDVCRHYGVEQTFKLKRLLSWLPTGRKLRLEKLSHGTLAPLYSKLGGFDMIHTRDLLPLMIAHIMRVPWSFETYRRHAEEKLFLPKLTKKIGLERSVGAVAHSNAAAEDLVKLGFGEAAVLTARPGFEPKRFLPALSKREARQLLGLDAKRPLVVYVGNVGPSKGTDELSELAKRLPEVGLLVVGGAREPVEHMRSKLKSQNIGNVELVGHKPPSDVAPFMYAADVLYVPAIFHNDFAGSIASLFKVRALPGTPLKIYGYMASGRPIVSADQAHTQDILQHERTALMVPPRDAEASAAAVMRLLEDAQLADRLSGNAAEEVNQYTWENRGKRMLEFFERRIRDI